MITGKILQFQRRDLRRIQQPSGGFDWRWVIAGAVVFAAVGAISVWLR